MGTGQSRKQTNLELPPDLREWLRTEAFNHRRSQVSIVAEALVQYRRCTESRANPSHAAASRALAEQFTTGEGVDLEILRDGDRSIYGYDV